MKSPKIPAPEPPAPPVTQRAGEIEAADIEEQRRRRAQSAFQNTILRGPAAETPANTRNTLGY